MSFKSDFDKTLMHGMGYSTGQDLTGWIATEKFNGWRVRFDGKSLITRTGNKLNIPSWFTARLPRVPIDAELITVPRGTDRDVSRIMRSKSPDLRGLKLALFDFVTPDVSYLDRIFQLRNFWMMDGEVWNVSVVKPIVLRGNGHALTVLQQIKARGGEGLVIYRPGTGYRAGRIKDVVKLYRPEELA